MFKFSDYCWSIIHFYLFILLNGNSSSLIKASFTQFYCHDRADERVDLSCPPGQILTIERVHYFATRNGECSDTNVLCEGEFGGEVRQQCQARSQCYPRVEPMWLEECRAHSARFYVAYRCSPGKSRHQLDLCGHGKATVECGTGNIIIIKDAIHYRTVNATSCIEDPLCTSSNPAEFHQRCSGERGCVVPLHSVYINFRCTNSNGLTLSYDCIPGSLEITLPSYNICSPQSTELQINAKRGFIHSPNYEGRYGNDLNCIAHLPNPTRQLIEVYMIKMNMEWADILYIQSGTEYKHYKGDLHNSELLIRTVHQVSLTFFSNSFNDNYRGFLLYFEYNDAPDDNSLSTDATSVVPSSVLPTPIEKQPNGSDVDHTKTSLDGRNGMTVTIAAVISAFSIVFIIVIIGVIYYRMKQSKRRANRMKREAERQNFENLSTACHNHHVVGVQSSTNPHCGRGADVRYQAGVEPIDSDPIYEEIHDKEGLAALDDSYDSVDELRLREKTSSLNRSSDYLEPRKSIYKRDSDEHNKPRVTVKTAGNRATTSTAVAARPPKVKPRAKLDIDSQATTKRVSTHNYFECEPLLDVTIQIIRSRPTPQPPPLPQQPPPGPDSVKKGGR